MVLRFGGQRPVRPDHPATGVLPDPRRGEILRGRAAEIAAPGRRHAGGTGSGTSEKTRILLDALRTADPAPFIPSTSTRVLKRPGRPSTTSIRQSKSTPSVGDFEEHLGKIPEGGRRLVAFLGSTIGNLTPRLRGRISLPRCPTLCSPVTSAAGHRPGQGRRPAGPGLRRQRGRDRRSSTATCWRWSTANSTPTSTWTRSTISPAGMPTTSASRCGCGSQPATGAGRRTGPERRLRRRGGHAHRGVVQVPAGRGGRRAGRGRPRCTYWWTDGPGTSGCRCRRSGATPLAARAVAGGAAEGRRGCTWTAPPVRGRVRGDRRGGPARPARGRGRRLCGRGGRGAGAGRGPRRRRRADRDATRRRRLHHGSNHALDLLLGGWSERPHRCVPARRVRPEPGVDGRERVRGACTAGRRRGPAARRRCGHPAATDPPALVHLTPLASHRGVVQPMGAWPRCAADWECRW